MREILFRAKSIDSKQWEYGQLIKGSYYLDLKPIAALMSPQLIFYPRCEVNGRAEIIPETVGQFTGLTDKNGKQIFEGDICKSDNGKQSAVFVVKFGEYYPKMFYDMLDKLSPGKKHLPAVGFYGKSVDKGEEIILFQSPCVTVIGNIHDNPELVLQPKGE